MDEPVSREKPVFPYKPELRLSHYFSQVLLPAVSKEMQDNVVLKKLRQLGRR